MFEKVPVNNPGPDVQEIFKLRNVKYNKCLTGHIVGEYPMTVNGVSYNVLLYIINSMTEFILD